MRRVGLYVAVAGAAALAVALGSTSGRAESAERGAGAAQRGTLLSSSLVTNITPSRMANDAFGKIAIEVGNALSGGTGGVPQCGVALYRIDYVTIGVRGEPARASQGVFVPQKGCAGPFPIVGYSHGTNLERIAEDLRAVLDRFHAYGAR